MCKKTAAGGAFYFSLGRVFLLFFGGGWVSLPQPLNTQKDFLVPRFSPPPLPNSQEACPGCSFPIPQKFFQANFKASEFLNSFSPLWRKIISTPCLNSKIFTILMLYNNSSKQLNLEKRHNYNHRNTILIK